MRLCGVSLLPRQLWRPLPPLRMAALLARNPCIPGAKATWDRRGGGVLHICAGPDLVEQGEGRGGCRLEVLSCFREMAGGGAVGLLQALLSTDNDTRSKAEVHRPLHLMEHFDIVVLVWNV